MKLVVDTNVFASAALKQTARPFLGTRWIDQHDGVLNRPQPSSRFCTSRVGFA
jgi:hypothetical protein